MKRQPLVIGLVVLVVAVVVTFPLWSPFFTNDVVDEAFPSLSAAQRDAVRAMPADQQDVLLAMSADNPAMASDTAAALLAADTPMADPMPEMPAEPIILAQGSFIMIDAVHRAEGTATVYALNEARIIRFEDFRSNNGPDLHIYLSKHVPTTIFAGLGDDPIHLGKLKGNIGSQNYEIPAEVDLSEYQSVVIYCVPFGVVFSSAALTTTA